MKKLVNEEDFLEAIEQNAKDDTTKICESCGREINIAEDDFARGRFGAYYCIECDERILDAKLAAADRMAEQIQKKYEEQYRRLREKYERGEITVNEYYELKEDIEESENEDILECYRFL